MTTGKLPIEVQAGMTSGLCQALDEYVERAGGDAADIVAVAANVFCKTILNWHQPGHKLEAFNKAVAQMRSFVVDCIERDKGELN